LSNDGLKGKAELTLDEVTFIFVFIVICIGVYSINNQNLEIIKVIFKSLAFLSPLVSFASISLISVDSVPSVGEWER